MFLGIVLAVGNAKNSHSYTELLSLSNWSWSVKSAYPFSSKIYSAPTLFFADHFWIFGGLDGKGGSQIARYDPNSDVWTDFGRLAAGRDGHNVIFTQEGFFVIGGNENKPTEKCKFDDFSCECSMQAPYLTDYVSYPELFLTKNDYCM